MKVKSAMLHPCCGWAPEFLEIFNFVDDRAVSANKAQQNTPRYDDKDFICPQCGPRARGDEDELCTMCGAMLATVGDMRKWLREIEAGEGQDDG